MEEEKELNLNENEDQITEKEEKSIQQLEHKIEDLSDRLLRSVAETENIRRRYEKQLDEVKEYAITNFAKDLISVLDNLSRAIQFKPETLTEESKPIFDGVLMTYKDLELTLAKHGVIIIEPKEGDKFDYNLHHAISQIVSNTVEEGAIVGLMQAGYKIKDRLLRPATVSVAKTEQSA